LKPVLSTPEAAAYVGLSESTLNKMRCFGGGPRYAKVGARVVYPIAELDSWLNSKLRGSTSEHIGQAIPGTDSPQRPQKPVPAAGATGRCRVSTSTPASGDATTTLPSGTKAQ
jgi:predicted DNA-binding transcriptional regulator AlpA